jgi:hypothetical protein
MGAIANEPPTTTISIDRQVEEVVSWLVGVMEIPGQAIATTTGPTVRMTTCNVEVEDAPDSSREPQLFLYQEQALSPNFSQPYRQRFLRISPSADGQSVESLSFRPLQLEDWVGLCDRPQTERVVQISDMDRSSCSVLLQRVGATYMGETQPGGCPSNYRGAVRVTNHIILHPTGMETSDRGFDANGNQVWGSTGEPYRFQRRVVPSNSGV